MTGSICCIRLKGCITILPRKAINICQMQCRKTLHIKNFIVLRFLNATHFNQKENVFFIQRKTVRIASNEIYVGRYSTLKSQNNKDLQNFRRDWQFKE